MAELTEAAIHLHDAPPRGLAYIWAANVLGVGYLAVRMYELALAQYDQIGADTSVSSSRVSALYRVRNAQLAHIYWGLELDRTGDDGAAEHFRQAMALGAQARQYVPTGATPSGGSCHWRPETGCAARSSASRARRSTAARRRSSSRSRGTRSTTRSSRGSAWSGRTPTATGEARARAGRARAALDHAHDRLRAGARCGVGAGPAAT